MSESSDYRQDSFTNSETSYTPPFTDPVARDGLLVERTAGYERSHGFDNIGGLDSSGTIDPRMLDLRLQNAQSVGSLGQWVPENGDCQFPVTQAATQSYVGETANELFQSLGQGTFAHANEGPWTPQAPFYSDAATQRAGGPLATGPGPLSLPGPANIPQSGHNGLAIAGDGQQHSAALLRSSRSCSEFDSASSKERQSSSGSSKKVPIAMLHKAPSPGSDSSASSFDCAACEKRFTRSGDRERHEREIHHTIPQFYRCDVCGWDDIRLDKVQEHCRERHGQQRRFERYQLLHGTPDRVKRPRGPNKNPPKTKARR